MTTQQSKTLAIDFGTSNSACAIIDNGIVRRIPMERESETLPTAVFFPASRGGMRIGSAAGQALIDGDEGRYMRALKSALGTPLLNEARLIGGKRRSISDIITAFLAELKARAETATGAHFTKALSGRPVRFHSKDDARDAQAETDLRACYLAAGFEAVDFMYEPEAAALASAGAAASGDIGLIVDIGGGTSDFSVFEMHGTQVKILASHGIRLGGTNFDHAVSMSHVMEHLGHGSELERELGDGRLPVPSSIFVDLATWEKIPFLYTQDTRRMVKQMLPLAVEAQKLGRLENVLVDELGHDLAFAVERGKIAANATGARSQIEMGLIEKGLVAQITEGSLNAALSAYGDQIRNAAMETLVRAQTAPQQIKSVVFVGGSSLMGMVSREMATLCPTSQQDYGEAFTAVVDGLALATQT
jgi:hypothetical chaperone protein